MPKTVRHPRSDKRLELSRGRFRGAGRADYRGRAPEAPACWEAVSRTWRKGPHPVSLQDLGSIGELVAAIATVATLVYLAIQVRDNSRALSRANDFARAGSIHQVTLSFNELNWRLANDGELAAIYTRALAGEDLTPSEATRFVAYVNTYIATIENLVNQQSLTLGYSELDSTSALDLLAPVVRELLETTDGAKWWSETAPHLYVPEFRSRVDAAVAAAPRTAAATG